MPRLPHPPKFYERLHEASHRRDSGLYLAPGRKLVLEAIRSLPLEAFHAILVSEEAFCAQLPSMLADRTFVVPEWQLARISKQDTPDTVLAVLYLPPLPEATSYPPAVLAEGLQDPGNLGTLLRTLEWLGHSTLWLSAGSVDPFHPRAVRASMGSLFRLQVHRVEAWHDLLIAYHGRCVVADLGGKSPLQVDWGAYDSLYIGSEAHGPQKAPADWPRVWIPPAPTSQADSLNVTIAAALLLYVQGAFRAGMLRTSLPG